MKNQHSGELYAALHQYSQSGALPFHMPGHKRSTLTHQIFSNDLPYDIDITEIDGFDDLHCSSGILKRSAQKAAQLFGSDHAYMLVNGSTCGILAAVSSVTHRGDSVIIARNCHKAVYNACALSELDVSFIFPNIDSSGICGSISPDDVELALTSCQNAKAVVITSPTYEGVISDIAAIAKICHAHGAALIVDSAHGAHLPFCSFGKNGEPISAGADIVIMSLHKTLPSLTQTAAAFVSGSLADHRRFEKYLGVFETSSPSYVLMASIDACFDFLADSGDHFARFEDRLNDFRSRADSLRHLRLYGGEGEFSYDKSKLTILTSGTDINGTALMDRLRSDFHIELEMAYPTYALAMTSVFDEGKSFDRLFSALKKIDSTLHSAAPAEMPPLPRPMRLKMTNAELDKLPDSELTYEQAASGRFISRSCIYAYPPGIPIVAPGEIVGMAEYNYIEQLKRSGVKVIGV